MLIDWRGGLEGTTSFMHKLRYTCLSLLLSQQAEEAVSVSVVRFKLCTLQLQSRWSEVEVFIGIKSYIGYDKGKCSL